MTTECSWWQKLFSLFFCSVSDHDKYANVQMRHIIHVNFKRTEEKTHTKNEINLLQSIKTNVECVHMIHRWERFVYFGTC